MTSSLKLFLDLASKHYYNGTPIISDVVFDELAKSISYNEVGHRETANEEAHFFPLYSLDKFYEGENNISPLTRYSSKDKVVSPKLDGAAISILYINGKLVKVTTRGDGKVGRVITDKFIGRDDLIPQELTTVSVPKILQVDGEIVAPKGIANARNYAAGALNLLDVNEFKTRAVSFFAYSVRETVNDTYDADMLFLEMLGFNTVKTPGISEIYPTDGVVIRLNSNKEFNKLGYTSKYPRGAYALKERNEGVETTINDVVWQVGKSGKVTPVAILEPVQLGDALISRATLNNVGFIEALDINIGDRVNIIRAGEIIPCITGKVE